MIKEIQDDTLNEIKDLLLKINFLSKCSIDPNVNPKEIEKIFECLSNESEKILKVISD